MSEYDLAGRRTKLTYPGTGLHVSYDYLVTGEVSRIRENGATTGVGVLATYAYDDLGRRVSLTRGNGTVTSYTFDAASRLDTLVQNLNGTANDLTLGFDHNPAGQIVGNTRSNDAYAWTGHGSGTTAYAVNGLNQLTSVGGTAVTHDSKGNMTADGLGRTFTYSSENLMRTASGGVTLAYDPMLRLYQLAAGSATTRFAYDGLDLIAEYNGSNLLQRRYVHGPGMDEPLVQYEGTGTADRRFLHADERGSIIAMTDSTGALIGINSYDEFGVPGSGNAGRFQYTGQAWLEELGLHYYKARMYHPRLGRFMQTDPIGYGDGMNLYAYVKNDPVNLVDPLGLDYRCWEIYIPPSPGTGTGDPDGPNDPIVVTGGYYTQACADIPDDFSFGSGFGWGDPSYVPSGYIHASSAGQKKGISSQSTDFCGGSNWTRAAPDKAGERDISSACLRHDQCYASSVDRQRCDNNFFFDVAQDCIRTGGNFVGCSILAFSYWRAVKVFGWRFYEGSGSNPLFYFQSLPDINKWVPR